MLNNITIAGRLTRDPDLRQTQSGISTATFSIACDRDYSSDGERGVDFVSCVAFRKTAEFVSKYFSKGDMMIVSGRLQSRKYQDKSGNDRTSWEVIVNNAYFGSSKRDKAQEQEAKPDVSFEDYDADGDGDLPF